MLPVVFVAGSAAGAALVAWHQARRGRDGPPSGTPGDPWVGIPPEALPRPGAARTASLESVAIGLCEAARKITGAPAALVLRDPLTLETTILAVSRDVDRRLVRTRVAPDSVAGRACGAEVPIVGRTHKELFGQHRGDRRRGEEQGTAYPLLDGQEGIGALVVFDQIGELDPSVREQLTTLLDVGGSRLAMAATVRVAELRALTDELTGLWNRRALDGTMQTEGEGTCALLLVDLDHFKSVNDTFGHAVGDTVLRQVAAVVRESLRERDLAARVGGEEFAAWLPNTPLEHAREVAERVRAGVAAVRFYGAAAELRLTCSVGLAAKPATVSQVANLYPAADAALYRAKDGGRDRVEVALPSR